MCFHIWRTRFVGQGISAALQYFIIMLSFYIFHLYHEIAAHTEFGYCNWPFLVLDKVWINFVAVTETSERN